MKYSEKLNILVRNTLEEYSKCAAITLYKKYYDKIDYYNKKYKGKVNSFFTDNDIDQKLFCEGMIDLQVILMLEKLKDNTKNILVNVEKYWLEEDVIDKRLENKFDNKPNLGSYMINHIRMWLFDNSYSHEMLSLEEQNTLMKNYIHFDASMKKIKATE